MRKISMEPAREIYAYCVTCDEMFINDTPTLMVRCPNPMCKTNPIRTMMYAKTVEEIFHTRDIVRQRDPDTQQ